MSQLITLTVCREVLAIEETVIRFMKRPDGQAAELLQACAQPRSGTECGLLLRADDSIVDGLLAPPAPPDAASGPGEGEQHARLCALVERAHCAVSAQEIPAAVANGHSALALQKLVRCTAWHHVVSLLRMPLSL